MNFVLNFPLFLIVLSLMSAVISSILRDAASRIISMCLTFISFAANLVILFYVSGVEKNFTYIMGHYPAPWGNELRIGPTEAMITAAFSLILFLCLLGGRKGIIGRIDIGKEKYYHVMICLIQAAFLVLAYTNDIFTGYVFIEICTLASCGILMIRQNGRAILASVRYMIFSLIGSGLFLFGVIFLYTITGHLLFPDLKAAVSVIWPMEQYRMGLLASIALICTGLSIKSGLFPFHLWMADTYSAAIPCSSGILSGLVSKAYIFFLIKIIFNVFGSSVFYESGIHNVLFILGTIGVIVGSLQAIGENNLFRMVAYSSAAQIGYIYMGIGISPSAGVIAAIYQIIAHAFTKPAIFLASSQLSDAAHEAKKFHNLQGVGFSCLPASLAFSFEAMSMIGLPFTMGFISKYLFAVAAFDGSSAKMLPTLIVLAASSILNTMYFARTVIRFYLTPLQNYRRLPLSKQRVYVLSAVLFVLLNLAFGVLSKPFIADMKSWLAIF